jgi:hypothetical protein
MKKKHSFTLTKLWTAIIGNIMTGNSPYTLKKASRARRVIMFINWAYHRLNFKPWGLAPGSV